MSVLPRTIAVVTGTRSEFGLLRPVMNAIRAHDDLVLRTIVTGTHLLPPARTMDEIAAAYAVDAIVRMQEPEQAGRFADAVAVGRGVCGLVEVLNDLSPDIVVVLGDRIEALSATVGAAVLGIRLAHIHGGDRAEGIADESMRHAISKLAHIHFPATQISAQRLIAMGEDPRRVHVVGSPAIDGIDAVAPMSDSRYIELGEPRIVVALHPVGDADELECERALRLIQTAQAAAPTLVLHPNHDPGREGIMSAIEQSGVRSLPHLHRELFIGLLRRVSIVVGNSSAALIEAAAVPVRAVNIGRRQSGREKPSNVADVPNWDYETIQKAIVTALVARPLSASDAVHPYGDGRAGIRIAEALASADFEVHGLRKLNTY